MKSVPFAFYEHLVEHLHRSSFSCDDEAPLENIGKLGHRKLRILVRKFEKNCFNRCLGLCGENGVRDISVHEDTEDYFDPTGQDPLEALNDMRIRITTLQVGPGLCHCCEAFRKKTSDGEDEEEDDDYWDEDSKEPVVQMTPKQLDRWWVHKLKCFRYYDNIGIDLNSDFERLEHDNDDNENDNSFGSRLLNSLLDAWRAQKEPSSKFDLQLKMCNRDVQDNWDWSNEVVEMISRYVMEMHPNGKASVKIDELKNEHFSGRLLNINFRTNDDLQEDKSDSDNSGSESEPSPKAKKIRLKLKQHNFILTVMSS